MRTRLIFSDSAKNIDLIRKQFSIKYHNIEDLFSEVQKDRCNTPDNIDDYMLWHTIDTYSKEHDEKELETTVETPMNYPPLLFNDEIIYYTSDFYSVLTPRRIEILEYIHKHNLDSVKNLAEATSRDYKNVYDDVLALQKFGLLDFVREGKNKRPVCRLTGIEILFDK